MPKFAANLSSLFTEASFLERFGLARRNGFAAVEYLFPYDYPKEQLAEHLGQHDLRQVLFNLPSGNWEAGERGIACAPRRISEFEEGVALGLEYALALDCRQLNCIPGIMPLDNCPLTVRETLVSNLRYAATVLSEHNIRLLIEPINAYDYPDYFLNRSTHALAILNEVAHPNLFLLYDVYHMQIMEGNLTHTIAQNISMISHVQIGDVPGRHEPGTGEINFGHLFRQLDALGFEGWIGCQYTPLLSTQQSLDWIVPYRAETIPA
jgi:hydroxypyruvate isomerase